jgi:hypothetical protein
MEVHPLTLLTLAYTENDQHKTSQLLDQVQRELDAIVEGKKE